MHQCVISSGCVTSLVSSRKRLSSHSVSVPPGPTPVSSQPCTLCITDHYRGGSLNSLLARLFWRACELGRGKSNTAGYLFNESDLLSCLYLRADCLSALLSPFVTLLEKRMSLCRLCLCLHLPLSLMWWDRPTDVPRWSQPTCLLD